MINIADRLSIAYAEIAGFAKKHHRLPNSVALLAVSKTKPIEMIVDAYQQGHRKFGENYANEAAEKIAALQQYPDIEWHFIGPIQSNKTRLIADGCQWIHSIDRLKIAQRINEQRDPQLPAMNVLIQVNIDQEETKSGVSVAQVPELAAAIEQLPRLKLRGIMAIPQKAANAQQQNATFSRLNDCFNALKSQYSHVDTLSLGMSNDMEAAIAHGSTMVRIGTAIFGERS